MSVYLNYMITLLVTLVHASNSETFNKSEVILVNVLFRHGERTPERFYPSDPHKENIFYPTGLGSLTNEGKLTVYKLGVFLRNEYNDLLGDEYAAEKIYVRSTESPRAQMSALLAMAGMWPPKGNQKWHPTLLWQPVPIEFHRFVNEDLLDSRACKYAFLFKEFYLQNRTMTEKFIKPLNDTFKYIEDHSGMKIRNLIDLQAFYFILSTENELGLVLPKWTEKVYPEPIYSGTSIIYKYFNSDLRLKKINVGYLLQKMVNDFSIKIKNASDAKVMSLYSAHDTTLGYFIDALTEVTPHVPKYGSAVIMELHRYNGSYFVKLRYLRSPKELNPEDLKIPNCEVLCPFNKFMELYTYLMPSIPREEVCEQTTL